MLDKRDVGKLVEGRFRVAISTFLALLVCVSMLLSPIGYAYADDFEGGGGTSSSFNNNFGTVWYGPTGSGGAANILYVRYGVVANTKYDAALYCCKGSSFDLSDLSNKKKSKLLNNADFKQFADLFNVGKPELTDDWGGDASIVQAWNSARQLYGETYCWNARYTNDQKIRAQEAIEDVLNDDDTGSGGGATEGVESGDFIYWPATQFSDAPRVANVEYLGMRKTVYQSMLDFIGNTNKSVLLLEAPDRGGRYNYFWYFLLDDANNIEFRESNLDGNQTYYLLVKEAVEVYQGGTSSINTVTVNGKVARQWGFKNVPNFSSPPTSYPSGYIFSYWPINYYAWAYGGVSGDGGGDEPTEPPIEWPVPPTETPKPPDVPTPGDPVGPNPWIPIPDDDIDITGDNFQDLLDALNEHCIHLQNSIESNVSQLWDLQSDFLGSAFEDLKSYLHELFEWLSDQLNFDVTVEGGQYDDTSVLYWLKQIWAKLPTGINTRPTDPVTDPNGWWDWFSGLLAGLIGSLADIGLDKIGGLVDALDTLKDKFPFCIPWDIAALLGLLVSEPVTPVIEVPLMALGVSDGVQQVGSMVIDLEPYDDAWEAVRWIERIAFCVYLATRTKDFLDLLGKIKG